MTNHKRVVMVVITEGNELEESFTRGSGSKNSNGAISPTFTRLTGNAARDGSSAILSCDLWSNRFRKIISN